MQIPPVTYSDISFLLAVGTTILLITAEITSPYYGLTNFIVNRKKLRTAALSIGAIFLIVAAIQIIGIIL